MRKQELQLDVDGYQPLCTSRVEYVMDGLGGCVSARYDRGDSTVKLETFHWFNTKDLREMAQLLVDMADHIERDPKFRS